MTSLTTIAFNHSQLKPLVCMRSPPPLFWAALQRNLLKCLVIPGNDSGSTTPVLAMVRRNAASMACVQVWSDYSCSQCSSQYYCPPLALVSMHSYCFLSICLHFLKVLLSPCAVLLHLVINYLDYCIAYYDEATILWYVLLCLKLLRFIKKRQCLFCRQDASSNRLGRNEVNTEDTP